MPQRQMHLAAYLKTGPTALHVGGWRHPESTLDSSILMKNAEPRFRLEPS